MDNISPPGEFLGRDALCEMARAAESAGFDACAVTDHPAPTGRWLDAGGHHAQDPFVALAFIAAVTSRIRLQTAILVLPYRNPFLVARAVATLEALAPARFILGAGAGYMKGEYYALGAVHETRNEQLDEYLRAVRLALGEDEFSFEGTGYSARGIRIAPRPATVPPIWVGGNSKRAIRRAAELGDGWTPFFTGSSASVAATSRTSNITSFADVAAGIALLQEESDRLSRPRPVDVALDAFSFDDPFDAGAVRAQLSELERIGVTWVGMRLPGETRAVWCANVERFGAEVINAAPV